MQAAIISCEKSIILLLAVDLIQVNTPRNYDQGLSRGFSTPRLTFVF